MTGMIRAASAPSMSSVCVDVKSFCEQHLPIPVVQLLIPVLGKNMSDWVLADSYESAYTLGQGVHVIDYKSREALVIRVENMDEAVEFDFRDGSAVGEKKPGETLEKLQQLLLRK